jgi:hypothetical protein
VRVIQFDGATAPSTGEKRKRSGLDESQQVCVDRVGVSGRHTVRETRVRLQRAVLHDLHGERPRGGIGDDLVGVSIHHEDRDADFLQVVRATRRLQSTVLDFRTHFLLGLSPRCPRTSGPDIGERA